MGGRISVESVVRCSWNGWPDDRGIRNLEQARKAAEEDYCGCYSSLADYAQELTEETTSIPQHLAMYIDYRAMACDMEYGGDVFPLETGFEQVHVFWNR